MQELRRQGLDQERRQENEMPALRRDRLQALTQSTCIPLAFTGFAHFSTSALMNLRRYSGLLRSGAATMSPMASNRSRSAGLSSALLTAALNFATIAGVALFGSRIAPAGAACARVPASRSP